MEYYDLRYILRLQRYIEYIIKTKGDNNNDIFVCVRNIKCIKYKELNIPTLRGQLNPMNEKKKLNLTCKRLKALINKSLKCFFEFEKKIIRSMLCFKIVSILKIMHCVLRTLIIATKRLFSTNFMNLILFYSIRSSIPSICKLRVHF